MDTPVKRVSFTAEVSRHLAPFLRLPFEYRCGDTVCAEPVLGACYYLIELFCARRTLQLGLALLLLHPQYCVVAVGVDGFSLYAVALHQSQRVYDGEKLAYVVCAVHWSEVEHHRTRGEIHATVFHRSGIARARRVYSPCLRRYLRREGQDGVVTVVGRIERLVVHCFSVW